MTTGLILLRLLGGLLLIVVMWQVFVTPRLRRFHEHDAMLGLAAVLNRWWCRLVHRVQFDGLHHLRSATDSGPVLFVANHTGGIDPLLVQTACARMVQWLMAKDMMLGPMADIWTLARVIPVDRTKADAAPLRRALRLLKQGQDVGIFPEGRITRPAGSIRPFMDGVGMLATRGGAAVLPVLIQGTPDTDSVAASVARPSHSRVTFLEPITFDRTTAPAEAAEAIRRRLVDASGWPAVDDAMPLELGTP